MTETAGGVRRLEDGPEALRTDENETETEIAIEGRGPGIVIGGGPVQGAASGPRGVRGTVVGAVPEAETEIEEGVIAFPDPERLEATADQEMIPNVGVPRAAQEPSRPPAETGTSARPSARPVQAPRRSPDREPSCPGS